MAGPGLEQSGLVPTQSPTATVLIVEEDESVLRSCADMLRAAGLQVQTVRHGDAAVAAIDGGEIHVVLVGMSQTGVSGPDLLRAIRERDAALPVIFVTSWPSFAPEEIASGSERGARNSAEALRGTVVTAAVGYCPLYSLLGMNTCPTGGRHA